MRIAIVGAGIVGAACAAELAAAGADVTVYDREFCGGGATAAGMGHLVVMDDSPAQFALTKLSVDLWHLLAPELGADAEHDPCGTLWVAADDEELEGARSKVDAYRRIGVDAVLLDATETAKCEPALRPGLAGAMRVPGDAVLYPTNGARALLRHASANGARVEERRSVKTISSGSVQFEGGEGRDFDAVVNAAGAQAPELDRRVPIQPRKGHLAITDRYAGKVSHQVLELGYLKSAHSTSGPSVAFNVQPRKTGQLLIGSSREYVGWDGSINDDLLRQMLGRTLEYMPSLGECNVIRVWTGFRPATADKLPLIGEFEPGLWVAAGHEGLGITTSTGTGRLLADQLLGRTPTIDPKPFDPRRFHSAAAVGGS